MKKKSREGRTFLHGAEMLGMTYRKFLVGIGQVRQHPLMLMQLLRLWTPSMEAAPELLLAFRWTREGVRGGDGKGGLNNSG